MCGSLRVYFTNLGSLHHLWGKHSFRRCLGFVQTSDRDYVTSYIVLLIISSFSQNNLTRKIPVIKYSGRSRHGLPLHNKFPKKCNSISKITRQISHFWFAKRQTCNASCLMFEWTVPGNRVTTQNKTSSCLKNRTHLVGRVLGIIFFCILVLKHHNLLNYLLRAAFWVLLHAIHVQLKTTGKAIRKRFWQTIKTINVIQWNV